MASFVLLLKEFEDEERVIYKFGPDENTMGKIELHKIKRKFTELLPVPDSNQSPDFYFKRAAQKISVHFLRENGQFPNRSTFES